MRLLLVGEDVARHHALGDAMFGAEAPFDRAADADEARDFLRICEYDLVVTGVDAGTIRALRAGGCKLPLAAVRIDEPDALVADAYQLGADTVLTAGFSARTIWAQLVATARRTQGHAAPVLSAGDVSVDMQRLCVTVAGAPVAVTAKERALLEVLMLRPGHTVGKESIMARLYDGMDDPEIKIVDVLVCTLRKKLKRAGAPDVIRTTWGQGYMVAA